jgi:uncharacterized membrane protein
MLRFSARYEVSTILSGFNVTADRRGARPLVSVLLLAVSLALIVHLAIFATSHYRLGSHPGLGVICKIGLVTFSALAYWSIYISLLATFGLTLLRGREALITAITRRMQGSMREDVARYTRKVTIAWTLFFAAQLLLSIGLLLFAPLVIWSFFVNVLDLPMVALMFAAEYAVRLQVLHDPPRLSFPIIFNLVADSIRERRQRPALDASAK